MAHVEALPQALRILGGMIPTAVITAGEDGAYIVRGERIEHVPTQRCAVVDTTGAGDAFTGGLLTALARDIEVHRAVDGANLVASRVVEHLGTRVPARAVVEWADRLGFDL